MSSTTMMVDSTSETVSAIASCINLTPDKNGYVPASACNANYNFDPSFTAAIIFTLLFFIVTIAHIYQAFYHKKLRLCWVLIMGCVWELVSFAIRSASTKMQQNIVLATVSRIFGLLAPLWINAFVYMVLGRMIYFFIPDQKVWGMRGIRIAKVFIWLDVIFFIAQLAGAVLISPGAEHTTLKIGIHIYMGGIAFQELCIVISTAIAIQFLFIMQQREKSIGVSTNQILDQRHRNWRPLLSMIFASLALITTRIIYRLIEFSSGFDPMENPNPISYHEWYFMVLDPLPMLIAVALINMVHPGRILVGEGSEYPRLSSREKKGVKRLQKMDSKAAKDEKRAIKLGRKDDVVYIGLNEQQSGKSDGYEENTRYPGHSYR
ncbi:hypothetical protein SBOR_2894 [Sclerotinia borealis F-4128]|uniref:RTA1 domain protein n=1 Tax=Sclerotinia borealis (strain F-4128) TaxID=1432307 RepID=W9CQH5_SCLBF|nr:hypothetical protein SBOR_2894 [Sclerotinia borealis F-4128]